MIHVTQQKPPVPKPPVKTRVLLLRFALAVATFTTSFFLRSIFPELMLSGWVVLYYIIRLSFRLFHKEMPLRNFRTRLSYMYHHDPHRLAKWLGRLQGIFGGIALFMYLRMFYLWSYDQSGTPEYYFWLFFATIMFMIAFIFFCCMSYLFISGKMFRPRDTHGSAHFANIDEMEGAGIHTRTSRDPASSEPVLELGYYYHKLIALTQEQQESHVMIVAPTGGGKTSGIIIPGLLQEEGQRSLVVNDVKGNLLETCAGTLAQWYDISLFTPMQPDQSHFYNPLDAIRTVEDAEDFADCWVENTGTSRSEPFWARTTIELIMAVTLHLCDGASVAPPLSKLADILRQSTLEELRDLLEQSPSRVARESMRTFMNALSNNPKLGGSIMLEVSSRFRLLSDPDIRRVTSKQEFNFNALADAPTAFFLSIPASEANRLKPLSACFLMQLMKQLTRRAQRSPRRRLPNAVAFYLDEFVNSGRIPHFEEYISLARSTGIAFLLAVQDFGRLKYVYGEDLADIIRANCNSHIVFPGIGLPEARYYSERIGETTITSQSIGYSIVGEGIGLNLNDSETRRRLMNPDEIIGMPNRCLLVLYRNTPPIMLQNKPYYERPDLRARARRAFYGYPVRVTLVTPDDPSSSSTHPHVKLNHSETGKKTTTGAQQPGQQPPPNDPDMMP